MVPPGGTVQIVVASPRPTVPDVTTNNPTVDEATKTLEDAGYKVETTERQNPDPALAGRVIGQSPPAGTARSTGGTVTIAIVPEAADPNATPSPSPTPSP